MRAARRAKRRSPAKTFRVGRHGGKLTVRTPSRAARERSTLRTEQLKNEVIASVKRALRDRGLLKYGSTAPDAILRQMYEDSHAVGDVRVASSEVRLHNYLSNSKDDSESAA